MSQKRLKVVISGGGTGGHIYPALAIARGLAEQEGAEILYVGGRQSLESRLAQEAGFAFREIRSSGLQGNAFRKMKALYANYQGMKEAKRLLAEYRPQLAIGTGGYVGAPVLFAAAKLGIPTMIHEQNAFPGREGEMTAVPQPIYAPTAQMHGSRAYLGARSRAQTVSDYPRPAGRFPRTAPECIHKPASAPSHRPGAL